MNFLRRCTLWAVMIAILTGPALADQKPLVLPDEMLEPDLARPFRTLVSDGVRITIYAARKCERPARFVERDPTVFTAGSGRAPYYYPQNPSPTSIELRAESNYFDLSKSKTLSVRVDELQPNTVYFYRVADSIEVNRFKTPPRPGEFAPFRFIATGDTQGPYNHDLHQQVNKDAKVMLPFAESNIAGNAQITLRGSNGKSTLLEAEVTVGEDGSPVVSFAVPVAIEEGDSLLVRAGN